MIVYGLSVMADSIGPCPLAAVGEDCDSPLTEALLSIFCPSGDLLTFQHGKRTQSRIVFWTNEIRSTEKSDRNCLFFLKCSFIQKKHRREFMGHFTLIRICLIKRGSWSCVFSVVWKEINKRWRESQLPWKVSCNTGKTVSRWSLRSQR